MILPAEDRCSSRPIVARWTGTKGKGMPTNLIATASVSIDAAPDRVWTALTDPDAIRRYMFGSEVTSDWQVGSAITSAGEYEGRQIGRA